MGRLDKDELKKEIAGVMYKWREIGHITWRDWDACLDELAELHQIEARPAVDKDELVDILTRYFPNSIMELGCKRWTEAKHALIDWAMGKEKQP